MTDRRRVGDGARDGQPVLRPAASPPRRLAVIGDLPHYRSAGMLYGLAPIVAQLERWANLFDEIVVCAPLSPGPPAPGFEPYPFPVEFEEVRAGGGNTRRAKLALVRRIPGWAWRTRRLARSVDAVYLRCPSNIAGVALLSTWRAVPYRCAGYAGVWRDYDGEPRPYRCQRRLLAGRFFDGPVSVYAPRDPARPKLAPFFSPSLDRRACNAAAPAVAATRARICGNGDAGPWRVIVVGRLTPNKNHAVAVEALHLLVDRGLDVSLDVVGEGPEAGRLQARAQQYELGDRVRFHGMVDHGEVLRLFAGSDLQLLTTRQEGYGKVLLEGMAAGVVPVLVESPLADEIAGSGRRAMVVDADDPAATADAVYSLVGDRDRWLSMVDAARDYAAARTLETYEVRVRQMLERGWKVNLVGRTPAHGR